MDSDKKYQFLQFVINYLLLPIACLFLLILCLIIFATTSHAANVSGPQFPILVENDVNLDVYQNYINANYGGFWDLSQDNVIGWGSLEQGRIWSQTFAIPQVPDQVQNYFTISPSGIFNTYPDFDYSNNTVTLTFSNLANTNNKPWRIITFNTITSSAESVDHVDVAIFNTSGTINKGVYGSTGSKLNYISSDIYFTNNNAWVLNMPIFVSELPSYPADIGVAIAPDGLFVPDLSDIVPPTKVPPTYTPSDYTWTPKPSFDDSSVDALLKSVYGVIEWGMENINGEFHILKQNLNGWFKYLGDLLTYYLNGIVESINAGIQNLYENIANVLQPIFDKVDYITQPIDSNAISAAFNENGLIQVKNDFIDFFNDFDDLIRNTPEPDTFDITINVQNVRTFYNFGVHSPVVLHLGNNLNGTLKTALRAFLWVLVIVGSIFLTEKNLSAWIKGGGFSDK